MRLLQLELAFDAFKILPYSRIMSAKHRLPSDQTYVEVLPSARNISVSLLKCQTHL